MYWEHDLLDRYMGEEGDFAQRWLNVTYDEIMPMNMRFGGTSLSMAEIGNLLDGALGQTDGEAGQQAGEGQQPQGGEVRGTGNIPAHPEHDSGHSEHEDDNPETAALSTGDSTLNAALSGIEDVLVAADNVLAGNVEINEASEQDPLLAALSMGSVETGQTVGESSMAGLSSKLHSADGFSSEQSALLLAVGVSSMEAIKKRKM